MKHTPGPWILDHDRVHAGAGYTEDPVCQVTCRDRSEVEATARLIAATPDLLDALYSILNVEGAAALGVQEFKALDGLDVPHHFNKVRAAIARATGE